MSEEGAIPERQGRTIIQHWTGAERKFLRVTVRMTNNGNVLLPIGEGWCTRIQQVDTSASPNV